MACSEVRKVELYKPKPNNDYAW